MQAIPLALKIASVAISATSAVSQIRQQQAQANANAQIAKANAARVSAQNAAETTIDNLRRREAIGEQRAQLARTGVDIGSGSADFLTKTTERNLQWQSDLRDASRRNEALNFLYEQSRYRQQAQKIGKTIPFTLLGEGINFGKDYFGKK